MPRFALLGAAPPLPVPGGFDGGGGFVGGGAGLDGGGVGLDGGGIVDVGPLPAKRVALTPLPQPEDRRQAARANSISAPRFFGGVQKLFKGLPSTNFFFKIVRFEGRSNDPADDLAITRCTVAITKS